MGKEISSANQLLIQELIYNFAAAEKITARGADYTQLKFETSNIGDNYIKIHNVSRVAGINVEAHINKSDGKITIVNMNDISARTVYSLPAVAIHEKYPRLEYVGETKKGRYGQEYLDPKTKMNHFFTEFRLDEDIDFSPEERPFINKFVVKGAHPDLQEHLANLPQDPVSNDIMIAARDLATEAIGKNNFINITGSSNYMVNGDPVINVFGRDMDGNTFCASFRNGTCLVYVRDNGGLEYTGSRFFETEIDDLTQHADSFEEMGRESEKPTARNPAKYDATEHSVLNPTPLQTLVMWTELESGLKAKFASAMKDGNSNKKINLNDDYWFTGYRCDAGVRTCGFGSTGKEYAPNMSVNNAFALMNEHIDYQRASLRSQIGPNYFDKLAPREQDALTSLGYNTGRVGEGLVGLVREYANNPSLDNRDAVCDKIEEYCKYRDKGVLKVASGLQDRRGIEVAIFKGQIDDISPTKLRWLVPSSIEGKTRQQLTEWVNGEGAGNRPVKDGRTTEVSDELKNQGMQEYRGDNGVLPQEVIDNALVQARAAASPDLMG